MNKLYAESCEQNRETILEVLRKFSADRRRVLETANGPCQQPHPGLAKKAVISESDSQEEQLTVICCAHSGGGAA